MKCPFNDYYKVIFISEPGSYSCMKGGGRGDKNTDSGRKAFMVTVDSIRTRVGPDLFFLAGSVYILPDYPTCLARYTRESGFILPDTGCPAG